jgi:hypothetical protein
MAWRTEVGSQRSATLPAQSSRYRTSGLDRHTSSHVKARYSPQARDIIYRATESEQEIARLPHFHGPLNPLKVRPLG